MLTEFRPVSIVFGSERRLLERSGYTCEACGRPVVADPDRRVERIDPARGDADHNVRIVCGRCGDDGLNVTAYGDRPTS
jgi:ribosomal protein S27AE